MIKVCTLSRLPLSSLNGAGLRVLNAYFANKDYCLRNFYWENAESQKKSGFQETQIPISLSSSIKTLLKASHYKSFFLESVFRDEIIVACPDSMSELLAMSFYPSNKKIAYIMDDFIGSHLINKNYLSRLAISESFRLTLRRFDQIWVISDFLKNRLQDDFGITVNKVLPPTKPGASSKPTIKTPFKKLLYVGSLKEPYIEPIKYLSQLDLKKYGLEIDLYGDNPPPQKLLNNKNFHYKGAFLEESKISLFSAYDMALVSYSFAEPHHTLLKYSFPSKLIDYLMAGLPILYLGPQDMKISNFLKIHEIGYSEYNLQNIEQLLLHITQDNNLMNQDTVSNIQNLQKDFSFELHAKALYQSCLDFLEK